MIENENLLYILNHVFLPPQLPQSDDGDTDRDLPLLKECASAATTFQSHVSRQDLRAWNSCIRMIENMIKLRNSQGTMQEKVVEAQLKMMCYEDVLAFHIRGQNAGLIVREKQNHVSFESLELSPTTSSVMSTAGRLKRHFPGPAISISKSRMSEMPFRKAMAQLLAGLDNNTPLEALPTISKAKSKSEEIRDTVHPMFVTEMLTGILRGIGSVCEVVRIQKCTRDDVLWCNTLKPWRRSPLWLLVRVALQTTLAERGDGHQLYKSFMIFLMAHILQLALRNHLSSDVLFIMAAKVSRRLLKLVSGPDTTFAVYAQDVVKVTHEELHKRWEKIQNEANLPLPGHELEEPTPSFSADTSLSLLSLKPYLASITQRPVIFEDVKEFQPMSSRRITADIGASLPRLIPSGGGFDFTTRLSVLDMEAWVETSLTGWLKTNLTSEGDLCLLSELISNYIAAVAPAVGESPEAGSFVILTLMDLWVALDKCTLYHHPLLGDYDPGFPASVFDPLLLPQRLQMERLNYVEGYLSERRRKSKHSYYLLFQEANDQNSFGVRYFKQSLQHQQLRLEIEAAAAITRNEKMRELRQLKQEYTRLLREATSRDCDEETKWIGINMVSCHAKYCHKCRLESQAKDLKITVHEWPIPYEELEAKSVIFELDVPSAISVWRDTTFTLLADILSPKMSTLASSIGKVYSLREFTGLSRYVRTPVCRLQVASESKPFVVSHYKTKKVSVATEESICVHNGLHYSFYDAKSHQWSVKLLGQCGISKRCTFRLPSGSFARLQYALDATTHTSNEVLARQNECPATLDLHSYYAFATLRSGHRLQWRNIARELVARILDISREETYLLFLQTAWQAGCSNSVDFCRDSHIDLQEKEFGESLILALEEALITVEGSWQGSLALCILVILAKRLLSLSKHPSVYTGCYKLLRRARAISLDWTRELRQLLDKAQDTQESKKLGLKALEVAMTCHGTFDVDQIHRRCLMASNEDVAVVVECSIAMHHYCPASMKHLPSFLQDMVHRFERLSQILESEVRRHILVDDEAMNIAVGRVWDGYRQGCSWIAMNTPDERWLTCQTSCLGDLSPMKVHYNLLDGTLLVNMSPLTRLPRAYELHESYIRLFGEKASDVVPSTMQDMIYELRQGFSGQQGTELIVRCRQEHHVLELVPISVLHGDFPTAFVQDYVHWLDINKQQIEWRPLEKIWASSTENWQMRKDDSGKYILSKSTERLIDVQSRTAKFIYHGLKSVEELYNMNIVYHQDTDALDIQLPRLKLDFSIKDFRSLLVSKQFKGMMLDRHQSFGTLTGLINKLVLCGIDNTSRCVIVPYGHVSFHSYDNHVQVSITTGPEKHLKYHSYQIDDTLGRLVDNGSLQSRLFRLYLHATTSHCLVDKLTGRTGTEEALYGLSEAATRSFVTLEQDELGILRNIADLTPKREFYPQHLQVMQQVKWGVLPPLSQHCDFYTQVSSVLEEAQVLQVFQKPQSHFPPLPSCGREFLRKRAAIRESSFQIHGSGAEAFATSYDKLYTSRDRISDGTRELNVAHTSKLTDLWCQDLEVCPHLFTEVTSWDQPLTGPKSGQTPVLGLDVEWLEKPSVVLSAHWCSLHNMLASCNQYSDKYKVMVLLCILSYAPLAKQEIVQTLLALATVPSLRVLRPPRFTDFNLTDGYEPTQEKLSSLVKGCVKQYYDSPEAYLPIAFGESEPVANRRRRRLHKLAEDRNVRAFTQTLLNQWPTTAFQIPQNQDHRKYIMVEQAMTNIRPAVDSWSRNALFVEYIKQIAAILATMAPRPQTLQRYQYSLPREQNIPRKTSVNFTDLMANHPPWFSNNEGDNFDGWVSRPNQELTAHDKLQNLLDIISSRASSGYERKFSADLEESFKALRKADSPVELSRPDHAASILEQNLTKAREQMETRYKLICGQLRGGGYDVCHIAGLSPRLSPTSILCHLSSKSLPALSSAWKTSLVMYGISITIFQQAERLLAAADDAAELLSELVNTGHQDWDPLEHPEWLLLEIENNILIRQNQAQIARQMVAPSSHANVVMQMNMGQGKSSVVVPMAATDLADGKQMVRVVVLKPLAMQMFQLLVKKLGSMCGRRICYLPISRSLDLDASQARMVHQVYQNCKRDGAIIVIQPEHILSFELMGFEQQISGSSETGKIMADIQQWLDANTRDILDESDEILSIRFELIYTIGLQRAIESGTDRWKGIQDVLGLLNDVADQILHRFPMGLEKIPSPPGSFARLRILQKEAGDELLENVAGMICERGLPGINIWTFSDRVKHLLLTFITEAKSNIEPDLWNGLLSSDSMRNSLLLLRGLFASGILQFAFEQKRWRVNYGHDVSRSMLAVPYHAKDVPAARAEFSHPDITIVLTCLSYYYKGLSNQQIQATFEALLLTDYANEEYDLWVMDAPSLRQCYHRLTGVNLGNEFLCEREIFPPLRFARRLINFYLSAIVFPSEMKEFPHKLSSSGWDIAKEKPHPTTGFSGTNDSKYVLPLSISQCDLEEQLSTNALVLDILLRPENTFPPAPAGSTGVLNANVLIDRAVNSQPPVRVVLDVGAQVLELTNREFARAWLCRVPKSEAEAVIFFNAKNETCVLSRDGREEALLISPFVKQMHRCLIYYDESHTRGTDFNLPSDYRAIVTLSPGLTKDRFVQACMRMRKLGKGQSLALCCSLEVQLKILEYNKKVGGSIEIADVLAWCAANTCTSMRRGIPSWVTQGVRHQHRQACLAETDEILETLLEVEALTLKQRYEFKEEHEDMLTMIERIPDTRGTQRAKIIRRCEDFEITSINEASLQEEQERELSPENEREQQVELPPSTTPHIHKIHPDLRHLIAQGVLIRHSESFQPAFQALCNTTANDHLVPSAWSDNLLVTFDFARTVQAAGLDAMDSFLRPVHWIVSCEVEGDIVCLILSPYEAHELIPAIRAHRHVTLHIYSPRISKTTRTFEDLLFCAIPPIPRRCQTPAITRQLNLFAGQLYIRTHEEYVSLCNLLGLCSERPADHLKVSSTFIDPDDSTASESTAIQICAFMQDPVTFLKKIGSMRRKGQSFARSHVGRIINGDLLLEGDFDGVEAMEKC